MKRTEISILGDSPGTCYHLTRLEIGPDDPALPKIFIQAGLHAGEQPGIMILHHLLVRPILTSLRQVDFWAFLTHF